MKDLTKLLEIINLLVLGIRKIKEILQGNRVTPQEEPK